MEPLAMMDGGDILRLGNLFFVGRSTRTNDAGIEELGPTEPSRARIKVVKSPLTLLDVYFNTF